MYLQGLDKLNGESVAACWKLVRLSTSIVEFSQVVLRLEVFESPRISKYGILTKP